MRLSSASLILSLVACGGSVQEVTDTRGRNALKIVTSFLPMTLFTTAVAGDCATVSSLIPPNLGPHDFQATPASISSLREAQLLVKNGLGMEEFLEKLVISADNPNLVVIDTSNAVLTLDSTDDHAQNHHDHHHDHGVINPHIWLDPIRAIQQVENIRDGLVKADPSCAKQYKSNSELYIQELQKLNDEISDQLAPYSGKSFVAFHDFAPYFAERYNLKADYIVDLPEMNPSPADLQRVAAKVRKSQLKALLSEPQEGNRSFNALANDLGVQIVEFNPLETGSVDSAREPETYFDVMRSNTSNLVKAIGG